MPRYVRQPHTYSCGPTAILNSLKWVGLPYTIALDYERILESCDCDEHGTNTPNFDRTLRQEADGFVDVRRKYRPTLREIDRWVSVPHRSVVLLYWDRGERERGHYMFLTDPILRGKYFVAINDGPKSKWLRREQLKQYLAWRRREKRDVPCAWFLKVNVS